jgi:carbonic anhydrase
MDPITKLTQGYKSFRDGSFQKMRPTYETLVDQGQHPKVALVACSDSRVDPTIVLQADPGDLFVIRNVANLVPPYEEGGEYHGTSAALSFAVEQLAVDHVIVLGHAHCGGIRSMFDERPTEREGKDFIAPWMSLVKSAYLRVEGTMPEAPLAKKAHVCEQAAVLVSLENLMTFPAIRERVAAGRLRLHGWHIDIRSCVLSVYDPARQHFETVS